MACTLGRISSLCFVIISVVLAVKTGVAVYWNLRHIEVIPYYGLGAMHGNSRVFILKMVHARMTLSLVYIHLCSNNPRVCSDDQMLSLENTSLSF